MSNNCETHHSQISLAVLMLAANLLAVFLNNSFTFWEYMLIHFLSVS